MIVYQAGISISLGQIRNSTIEHSATAVSKQ